MAFILVLFCYWHWRLGQYLKVEGRSVLITGCDSGFGNKLAKSLDKLGVIVYAGCKLETSIDLLKDQSSPQLKAFVLDVTDPHSISEAFNFVSTDLNTKNLWAVVNNAAVPGALVPFDWSNVDDHMEVFDVNFFGIIRTTLAFLPLLKQGKEGRIINVSSINGRLNVNTNPYGVSKCGVEALSNGLSFELKPFNITVHTLEPSIFKTNITSTEKQHDLIWSKWTNLSPQLKLEYGNDYPSKRVAYVKNLFLKKASSNLDLVILSYKHALFAKYPNNRYVIGWEAKLIYLPLSWLPFPILAFILPHAQKLAGLAEPAPQCSQL